MTRHHLMTSVKNEAVYLLEWIAHHKAIGFDEIFIAANNCNDGTQALLSALHRAGFVKFARNKVAPDKVPQHEGYARLRKKFDVDACDWLMTLDVDEFLYVQHEDGDVSALTGAAGVEVDIIALNSLTYGTAQAPKEFDFVTRRFVYRLPELSTTNRAIKSITRNPSRFRGAHNHHMVKPKPAVSLTVMRADGTTFEIEQNVPLWRVLRSTPKEKIAHGLAHYNHYSIKSRIEYSLRQKRGRGAVAQSSDAKKRHSKQYFERRVGADIVDTRIEKYSAATQSFMDTMLANEDIRKIHEKVVARFLNKVEALRS